MHGKCVWIISLVVLVFLRCRWHADLVNSKASRGRQAQRTPMRPAPPKMATVGLRRRRNALSVPECVSLPSCNRPQPCAQMQRQASNTAQETSSSASSSSSTLGPIQHKPILSSLHTFFQEKYGALAEIGVLWRFVFFFFFMKEPKKMSLSITGIMWSRWRTTTASTSLSVRHPISPPPSVCEVFTSSSCSSWDSLYTDTPNEFQRFPPKSPCRDDLQEIAPSFKDIK